MMPDLLGFRYRFVAAGGPTHEAPTLLLLHGTGGNEDDLIGLGRELLPEANLLSPRGKVLENGMPRFFRRLAEGVFDEEDLRLRTHELAGFLGEAARAHSFDLTRVVAVGFSNGANIAGSLLMLHPDALSAAILFRPMVPFVPEVLPDLRLKPVFIGAGRSDPIVSTRETERLDSLLRHAGADVTLAWQDNGHGLTDADVRMAKDWLSTIRP